MQFPPVMMFILLMVGEMCSIYGIVHVPKEWLFYVLVGIFSGMLIESCIQEITNRIATTDILESIKDDTMYISAHVEHDDNGNNS